MSTIIILCLITFSIVGFTTFFLLSMQDLVVAIFTVPLVVAAILAIWQIPFVDASYGTTVVISQVRS